MPVPDPRELSASKVGSNIRPRSATRDLRATGARGLQHIDGLNSSKPLPQLGATGEIIRVFPQIAEFRNTEPNVTHVLTITVVNRSHHSRRIRFQPPKTKEFTLHQIPGVAVAPGLEISADLEFFSEHSLDFSDELVVLCDTDRITIPIRALIPRGELSFDTFCGFGTVAPGSQNIRYVDIVNEGKTAAEFEIISGEDGKTPFVVEPRMARLGPQDSDDCFMRLKVSFCSDDLGTHRNVSRVKVNGKEIGDTLDLNAMVIRQQLEIVHPEGTGRLDQLQFGTLYNGESRTLRAVITNDNPNPTEFKSYIPKMESVEHDEIYFSVNPPEATLGPFEQKVLEILYHPPVFPPEKGFKSNQDLKQAVEDHEIIASFTAPGAVDDMNASLKLSGRSVHPLFAVSEQQLLFVETPRNQSSDLKVTVHNHHEELPIVWKASKIAHFKCRPASGRLLPFQSIDVIVSFTPNQLGTHRGNFVFDLAGSSGMQVGRAELAVVGSCKKESTKVMRGGVTATEETFEPMLRFQGEEEYAVQRATVQPKYMREKAWVKKPPEVNEDTAKYTYEAEHFDYIDKNNEVYNQFLKDAYNKRNGVFTLAESKAFALGKADGYSGDPKEDDDYAQAALEMGMFGMNVKGMPPGVGLKEPFLALPTANEPLYLKSNHGEGPGATIKPRSRVIDEDRIMMKKFKPEPTSQKEKRECATLLSHRQIMQISTHPSHMEFGSVCIQAEISKSFTVSNDTGQSIIVRIETHNNKVMSRSKPDSQVIPPGGTAGFDITLYLEATTEIDTKFAYTINDHHRFEVPVRAQAVPVMLIMNKQKLNFTFSTHNLTSSTSEIIVLNNPGSNQADFKIENGQNFTAFPSEGTVDQLSSEEVTITYRPGATPKHEQTLRVEVIGGTDLALTCAGEVDEGKIQTKTKTMDFGSLAAGLIGRKSINLHSTGSYNAVFYLDMEDIRVKCPGLSITPEKGMLAPGSSTQLVATLRSEKSLKIDSFIMVYVRGTKPIKLAVKADIIVPDVEVQTDEIDFGSTYLGASTKRMLKIQNKSVVPAIFTLDFRQLPEFTAEIPSDFAYEEEDPVSMGSLDDAKAEGKESKFRIGPNSKGEFQLIFSPVALGQHALELPLSLQGINPSGAKMLRRAVMAEAEKPRLLLSQPHIEFGKKVVVNEHMKDFAYSMEFALTNCDDVPFFMDARLKGPHCDSGCFKMEGMSGNLEPGRSVTLVIKFIPKAAIAYNCKLCICLDKISATPYFSLDVNGSGILPRLGFDRREVIMPTVPLGIETTVTFYIINHGYDNLDLQYEMPPGSTQVPITVKFPVGTMLGVVKTRLPVQVSFSSKKPMSFQCNIDFLDKAGRKYSIPIVGSAASAYLTCFPYLSVQQSSMAIVHKPGKPPFAQLVGQLQFPHMADNHTFSLERAPSMITTLRPGHAPPPCHAEFLAECAELTKPASVKFLLDWCNHNVFKSGVQKWPEDVHEARGKPVIDVVEGGTGKSVPNQNKRLAGTQREEAQTLQNSYCELLNFMKIHGALISNVRPEYLLPYNSFSRLYLHNEPDQEMRNFYEANYTLINSGTWLFLLYEAIEVCVLHRLTTRNLKSLPGVEAKQLQGMQTSGSNVYSSSELVLLQWLTYHHGLHVPTDKLTVSNFDKDLHDCRVFGSVIASHIPSMNENLSTLKKSEELEDMLRNAETICDALKGLGLEYCPEPSELATAPSRDLILFCTYLYNTMPGFLPKTTIDFEGRLNENVVKTIQLSNPSPKPLIYTIRIDGSPEFKAAESIRMGPKEKADFPITCLHKFRRAAQAQIFFIGERSSGGAAGSTLVFNLKSEVKSFKRADVIKKQTRLYEPISVEVPIKNISTDTETEIKIQIQDMTPYEGGGGGGAKVKGRKKPKGSGHATSSPLLPLKSFWVKNNKEQFKLKKGASSNLNVQFLPMRLTGHSCLVFIHDSVNGESCVEIRVSVDIPGTTEVCKFSHAMKSTVVKDYQMSTRNPSIDKCRSAIMEMMGQQAGKEWFKTIQEIPAIDYKIEYVTDSFSGPRDMKVLSAAQGRVASPGNNNKKDPGQNKLPLELRPKGPGKYESKIVFRSALDVRVLEVECTVTSLGTRAELTFNCPARHTITQEIPIINHSDGPWVIAATLQGDFFSGGRELQVPPMENGRPGKANYVLTFSPRWIHTVQGELTLRNTTIGDTYQYTLIGVGEDPVAEDHTQVECRARWKKTLSLRVRNLLTGGQPVTYKVESDLIGMAGKDTLDVPPDGVADYELSIMMPRGGHFTGSISFIAPSGEYIWYTFEVVAENPPAERTIELSTKARTAVAADINIVNPLDEDITFDVLIEGEGLLGERTVTLKPKERTKYELIFSPLLEGRREGGLTFVNDNMGEFWYMLDLTCEPADPIYLKDVVSEIGKSSNTTFQIENPLGEEIEFIVHNSNPTNFEIAGPDGFEPNFFVEPFTASILDLHYVPSSLNEDEETEITFQHPVAGNWVYICKGRGRPPSEMQIVEASAAVGMSSSNLIMFRNPLKYSMDVIVKLEDMKPATDEDCFALIHHYHGAVELPPFGELDVPFLFSPQRMVEHSCNIVIQAPAQNLQWSYPVSGTAEAASSVHLGKFTCKARERMVQSFNLELTGTARSSVDDKVKLEVIPPEEHKEMMASALSIIVDDALPKPPPGVSRVKMTFEPLKAVRSKIQLKVTKENEGRWLFDLELVATQADIDDLIRIEGSLNKTTNVAFKMTNQFETPAPYKAFFGLDSPPEFTVNPPTGILPPYGTEGQNFVISFTPKTYGKIYTGKLIVETEEMQWTYEVHGEHPKYEAPRPIGGKIDARIEPEADPLTYKSHQPRPNFMKDNATALKTIAANRQKGAET